MVMGERHAIPETIANARLIAAAPELLEVIRSAHAQLTLLAVLLRGESAACVHKCIVDAEEMLNKAEGK